jgi:general secretion pathway protein K
MRRLLAALARPIVAAHRRKVSRQSGFALIVVTMTVALLAAIVGEFGYNARVELESAANARDQLKAEYLARSGINLSRLLIKVQSNVLDPMNKQIKMDIQIGDFAPFLMKAFGGEDGADALSSFLGIGSVGSIKGLGVGKGSSFDVAMVAEDGKININCGGGLNPTAPSATPQQQPPPGTPPPGTQPTGATSVTQTQPRITNRAVGLYALLTALEFGPRYNRIFDNPDSDGQYVTRDEVARAIIDWSDVDENRFDPVAPSAGAEDYRYDALRDPYRAHNNFYDTVEEAQLVKGVGDDYWGSFGELFTVYGGCKVNLNAVRPENWPITAAIIRATATDPTNPMLLDDTMVAALAQQIGQIAQFMGGMSSVNDLSNFASGKLPDLSKFGLPGGSSSSQGAATLFPPIPGLQPITLNQADLAAIATVGPRQVYRIDSTGSVRRTGQKSIDVHIRAVWDTQHFNQNTTSADANDRMGTWVYWRTE